MFIDKPQKILEVNGKFQTQEIDRFDIYFEERDLTSLTAPEIAYVTDRFMGCTEEGTITGWAPEDKVHIRLKDPEVPEDDSKVAELQLDPGGDLYFTIWNSSALRAYVPIEFAATEPFVTSDPSGKLAQVGIKSFCFHQLVDLSYEIAARAKKT